MLHFADNVAQSMAALRAYKMRAALTMLGLVMGVATIITVMTLIQGANRYVAEKIANLGTDVFQIAKTPFASTDFNQFIKSAKYKRIEYAHYMALARACRNCELTGATVGTQTRVRHGATEIQDVSLTGQTASMAQIDTRTVELGRFFTAGEDDHSASVCLIGAGLRDQFFGAGDPLGQTLRIGNQEFTVIGTFEKIGSVLGQDSDTFAIVPIQTFLRTRGSRASLTLNVLAPRAFEDAQDEARQLLRGLRHVKAGVEDDFFIGTRENYIELWRSISGAFFAVFILVSLISSLVGGIVIMNVMLVSVTERTKEIGVRRALGASQQDIRRQFLAESITLCVFGGVIGVGAGFGAAELVRLATSFPVQVEGWVAALGIGLSSAIGLFFGIYPAVRASRLDPVEALRSE